MTPHNEDQEVVRPKAKAAERAHERDARLVQKRSARAASVLEEFRAGVPVEVPGTRLSREEENAILGYGPGGV